MVRKEQPGNTHCLECGKKFEPPAPHTGRCAEHASTNKTSWESDTPARNDGGTANF
jgi:hypothetical protein